MTITAEPTTSLFGQMYNDVEEFSLAFGQLISDMPTFPSEELQKARVGFITEEYEEFNEAMAGDDLKEVADALVDIPYFALGTALAYGIVLPGGRDYFDWTLIGTPKLYEAGNMREAVTNAMNSAYDGYIAAELDGSDLQWIAAALQKLINTCLDIAHIYNIPFPAIWDEVHQSNLAKMVDGKVIRDPDTGKVLKPAGWTPPDVLKVLVAAGHDPKG
nr:hypothetical protein [Rhodococcus sp. (in: high G+C Gram-positive bacteria)]